MNVRAQAQAPGNPLDVLLAGYANGTLSPPLQTLVASHLVLTPRNRGFVSALESAGGAFLDRMEPAALPDRDARLAAIFASDEQPASDGPERPVSRAQGDLPLPLARYVGMDLSAVPWRTLLPGVKEFRIEENEEGEASLLWIRGGRKMPAHTHEGSEVTLVLRGAFSDVNGHYGRGDIAIADADIDHRPIADAGEDCVCFAVTDAPLRLTGPIGRIVQRIFKN